MKYAHTITIRVFYNAVKDEEAQRTPEAIKEGLLFLLPFDLQKEKIPLVEEHVRGLSDEKMTIYTVTLTKESHTTQWLCSLLSKLHHTMKEEILAQKASRLDNDLTFFLRFDKGEVLRHRLVLTEGGDCYHITLRLAVYPKKRDKAGELLDKLFQEDKL